MAFTAGFNEAKSQAWATTLQEVLRQSVVGMSIANTKFEGLFSGSKTVHFPRINATSGGDLANPDATFTPTGIETEDDTFTLDNHKWWAVKKAEADIMQMKANPDNEIIKSLRQFFKEAWDTDIFKKAYTGAGSYLDAGNFGGTAGQGIDITSGEVIYDIILEADAKLTSLNASEDERFIVLSPTEIKYLKKYLNSRQTPLGDKVTQNGFVGDIDGFSIYKSKNLPTVSGVRHIIAGQGKPVCFASDIHPEVTLVSQKTQSNSFVDTLKSQSRFGAKVFLNDAAKLIDVRIKA